MSTLAFQTTHKSDGTVVLALIGVAEMAAARELDRELNQVCANRPAHLILDLSQLQFISSVCLGTLIKARNHAESYQGRVSLAGPNESIESIFRTARLDQLVPIYPSVLAAMMGT